MTGRLSDRFVCRVAGLPARLAADLRAGRSAALAGEICQLEERLEEAGERLSERLHERIGAEEDPGRRRALVALRRDLYNLREPLPADLAVLTGDLRQEAEDLLALRAGLERQRSELSRLLALETLEVRRHLRQALEDADFQGALLLSSRALYQARQRYLQTPPGRLRARDRQIERGLVRYLTRMALKATPFATFCAVVPGSLEAAGEGEPAALRWEGDPLHKQGHVRLSKAFYGILFAHLAEIPEVRRSFFVRLNPTLFREGEDVLVFLTALRGREVFQRLRTNPALEILRDLLAADGRLRTLGELIREIGQHPEIEEPEEVIEAYAGRLVEIGFLHLTTGIPAQELAWDRALEDLLAPVEHERARRSVQLLRDLRELTASYAATPGAGRPALLDRMEEAYEAWRSGEEIRVRARIPVYEDATAAARAILPRSAQIEALERSLAQWVELTSPITLLRRDQMNMRRFFESWYGDRESVPLLRFFEDYHREHYKAHLEREEKQRRGDPLVDGYDLANPFRIESVARLLEARHALALRIARGWAEAGEEGVVELTPGDLRDALRDVAPLPADAGLSVTFFGELVPAADPAGTARLVIRGGTYVPGYGKMFSRFLYLFPEDFAADLARHNRERTAEASLAELCDDANFNANLHPPLLPEEIVYPMTESRGGAPEILPSDLLVVRDPRDPALLSLRHAHTGRTVLPVDTGFLNPRARPPLYRLLTCFVPASSFTLPLPELAAPTPGAASAVLRRPRIVFDGRIVLARRTWLVPGALYPRWASGDDEAALFLRLARWRRTQGIPETVYITFHPFGPAPDSAAAPFDAEARKPQYIDFASPLLAELFARMAPAHEAFLAVLEERLPGDGELTQPGGEPVVSELVLQLDLPAAR